MIRPSTIPFSAVLRCCRAPFLSLTPVCVLLGASTAYAENSTLDPYLFGAILIAALFAHLSVNTLNEYQDFISGLDLATKRTQFSGGSGALPENPEMARPVLFVSVSCLTATAVLGLFFVLQFGWQVLPIGVLGLLLIVTYTGWINRHPLLCLISPGLGFGILMVQGTQVILAGEYSRLSWLAALVPFFLVNNLLLLNQYPDIEPDADAGRNHLPIAFGIKTGNLVYACFAIAAFTIILGGIVYGHLPRFSWIALLTMPLAGFAWYGASKHGETIAAYPRYLAANVTVAILTPLLLALSIANA